MAKASRTRCMYSTEVLCTPVTLTAPRHSISTPATRPPPTARRSLPRRRLAVFVRCQQRRLAVAPPTSPGRPPPTESLPRVTMSIYPPTPITPLVPQTPQTPPPDMYSGLRPDTLSDNSDTLSLIYSSSSSSLDTLLSSASSATAFVGRSPSHGEQGGSRLKASHRRKMRPTSTTMAPPRGALTAALPCKS